MSDPNRNSGYVTIDELLVNSFVPQEMRNKLEEYAQARAAYLRQITISPGESKKVPLAEALDMYERLLDLLRKAGHWLQAFTDDCKKDLLVPLELLLATDSNRLRSIKERVEQLSSMAVQLEQQPEKLSAIDLRTAHGHYQLLTKEFNSVRQKIEPDK